LAKGSDVPVTVLVEGTDFSAKTGGWATAMSLSASGALLVRPDGHLLAVAASAEDAPAAFATLQRYMKGTV
jgi:hypothetical protein